MIPDKYHVDIAKNLIAVYEKLNEADRDQWLQEQTNKWEAISKVKKKGLPYLSYFL